jgi:hypothetical protein
VQDGARNKLILYHRYVSDVSFEPEPTPSMWPPPPGFVARDLVDLAARLQPQGTLQQAFALLRDRLQRAGFRENAVFSAPEGFVLLTHVERIRDDGASFPDPPPPSPSERWTTNKLPVRSFAEYFHQLFLAKPGMHRLFLFAVTPRADSPEGPPLAPEKLWQKAGSGRRDLPDEVKGLALAGHRCHVFVYQFERRRGGTFVFCAQQPDLQCALRLFAAQHLELANIRFE